MTACHVTVEEGGRSLVRLLLADQQRLTAVERFGAKHDQDALPALEKYYRDLIPLSEPREGEQYVFEVDLDACTGCKACVAGCHSLNGLDDGEVWRRVGVVLDPAPAASSEQSAAFSRTVTSACHHCAEPACLEGCPVQAYEKDPVTGIVRHLDDQCIGCQYCVLKCPYEVPQYNASRGIVRKCDMCHGRLSAGEAPACVQACPTGAIRIGLASVASVVSRGERGEFLPGAPAPGYTRPSTVYKSSRELPTGLRAGDDHRLRIEPAHAPLVFMLVLTQAAVGLATAHGVLSAFAPGALEGGGGLRLATVAAMLGLSGIGVATLHLGRPQYAFRAFLGLRTSWLSRETVVFGALAPLLVLHAVLLAMGPSSTLSGLALRGAIASGVLAVACSVMVYVDTRRPFWSLQRTGATFLATTVSLGFAVAAAVVSRAGAGSTVVRALLAVVALTAFAKIALEASIFRHLTASPFTDLSRTARVMSGPLRAATVTRFVLGLLGVAMAIGGASMAADARLAASALLLLGTAELVERMLFFRAVAAPHMPGSPS